MPKFIPQNFNDLLALVVVVLVISYIVLTSIYSFNNKVVDLAVGILLAKFSDIIQFYFRRAKEEK